MAPKTVEVALNDGGTRVIVAGKLFLNVGTHASIPPVPGLRDVHPLTHIEALDLYRLPEHLIVLGGGYVGLELGQAYHRFGSRVTVVEHGARLVGREDPDVSEEVENVLRAEGVEVLLSADLEHIEGRSGDHVRARVRTRRRVRRFAGRSENRQRRDCPRGYETSAWSGATSLFRLAGERPSVTPLQSINQHGVPIESRQAARRARRRCRSP